MVRILAVALVALLISCTSGPSPTDPNDGRSIEGTWTAETTWLNRPGGIPILWTLQLAQHAGGRITGHGEMMAHDTFGDTARVPLLIVDGWYRHPEAGVVLGDPTGVEAARDTVPGEVIAPDSMVLTFAGDLEVRFGRR